LESSGQRQLAELYKSFHAKERRDVSFFKLAFPKPINYPELPF
jgi:hypothetical protein